MSNEFEKIVLQKFDTLASKIEDNSKLVATLSGKVEGNSKLIAINSKTITALADKVEDNSKLIAINFKAITTLSDKVEQQGLNFASFENEFNIKIQSLFDSFVSNEEKHVSYSKAISALNAESFRQGVRISVLEDNYKNSKLFN